MLGWVAGPRTVDTGCEAPPPDWEGDPQAGIGTLDPDAHAQRTDPQPAKIITASCSNGLPKDICRGKNVQIKTVCRDW